MADILKCIFLNENASVLIPISQNFVPWGTINNKSVLVQVRLGAEQAQAMAWTMMTNFYDKESVDHNLISQLTQVWWCLHREECIAVKVTLDISGSPIESQWGSWKYPG